MSKLTRRDFLRGLLALPLAAALPRITLADGPGPARVYLPLINGNGEDNMADDPILAICCADGSRIDLLSYEAGFQLDDPGWRPQLPQLKGGGSYSNSMVAEGQTLVAAAFDNVIESIPLTARAYSEEKCLATLAKLWQAVHKASQYWTESSRLESSWLECRPPGCEPGGPIGYSRISKVGWVDYANPYGQPMFSQFPVSVADGLSLVIEREPFWRLLPPGERLGPLYNLLRNPDFEDWNSGVADSQPDCWDDLETPGIVGTNARDMDGPKWGASCLKISVTGSAAIGAAKGIAQAVEGTEDGQTYTFVGWVRNSGIISGVGRILITSLLGQYEAYRSANQHGWQLVTFVFTAGVGDVIGINCEVLSTATVPQTLGTVYFDSLMLLPGDFETYAESDLLPYISSSHVFNHWDQPGAAVVEAGRVNFLDVWNTPGDVDTLSRLEVKNNTLPADYNAITERIAAMRVGLRRTGDVFDFDNYTDPPGVVDATASSGDRVVFTPTADWQDVVSKTITGAVLTQANNGRFRVFCRAYDNKASGSPTLELRLKYWLNTATQFVYGDAVTLPVRQQWTDVGLTPTKAMIWDAKFRGDQFGAVGYVVQARRVTGTGQGYIDRVLAMPTDGGYLSASIDPSALFGVGVVVDNTASAQIGAAGLIAGYTTVYQTISDYEVRRFAYFNGDVYACTTRLAPNLAGVYRRRDGQWSRMYSATANFNALEVWGPSIFASSGWNAPTTAKLLSSADGGTWSTAYTFPDAGSKVWSLRSFNGLLWVGYENAAGPASGVYTWDGSAMALSFNIPLSGGGSQSPYAMEVYGGKLFLAVTGAVGCQVYAYTPGTGWALNADFPALTGIFSLQTFGGKLYMGTTPNAGIYVYDGSAWSLVYSDATATSIDSLAVLDGKIYAGRTAASSTVLVSSDGTTWATVYDPGQPGVIHSLLGVDGALHIGIQAIAPGFARIYSLVSDRSVQYAIANYTGGSFDIPSRKLSGDPARSRFIFTWDRDNRVHTASDRVLAGVAFVPRYSIIPSRR